MGRTRSAQQLNYYEHHLGDYLRDTAHLSLVEDAIYRRLLDQYYIRERPLPADEAECAKLARASDERQAVAYVLTSFFELRDDGWHQARADGEIARFHDKSQKARTSANARWRAKPNGYDRNADAMRTHSEGNALQSPIPIHQKKKVLGGEPPEWDLIRSEFPKRQGNHRWADARSAINARLREGHTWAEILDGVRRYAAFVRADGKEGTPYVQQAATFLGTNKGFQQQWSAKPSPNSDRFSKAL
jgi:uncharacterized protein YdaU (DUF1376 family)